jgi:hypothetical protein
MQPMSQFVIWHLHGVRYLCVRNDDSYWLRQIKRLPN